MDRMFIFHVTNLLLKFFVLWKCFPLAGMAFNNTGHLKSIGTKHQYHTRKFLKKTTPKANLLTTYILEHILAY